MPEHWVIRFHPDATRSFYQIPRGMAGLIGDAIERLRSNPWPPDAKETSEPELYEMQRHGYSILYAVNRETTWLTILVIDALAE